MMIDNTISLYALLIANAFLVAAASLAVLRFQRMLRDSADFWKSPTGAAVQEVALPAKDHSRLLAHKISKLQKGVDELRQRDHKTTEPIARELPFEHAVRMVKRGASIDELTKSCGLNLGEARLMRRLHGQKSGLRAVKAGA